MARKIIIDTDIGDDIDDAFALILMLAEFKEEIVGVTTVYKNALERAQIASYLIKKNGTIPPLKNIVMMFNVLNNFL